LEIIPASNHASLIPGFSILSSHADQQASLFS
jgi:hypothetical protein